MIKGHFPCLHIHFRENIKNLGSVPLIVFIAYLVFFEVISSQAVLIERIAAVIDDEVITYSAVQIERIFKLSEGSDAEVLQKVIDRRLLLREAEKFKVTETEEDRKVIHQRLKEIKSLMGEERFYDSLKEYKLTESDILKILKEKAIAERYVDFRINFFIVISDDAVKIYYNGHRDEFNGRTPEEVYPQIKARLFQIESERRLEEYLGQLKRKTKILVNL